MVDNLFRDYIYVSPIHIKIKISEIILISKDAESTLVLVINENISAELLLSLHDGNVKESNKMTWVQT